MNITLIHVGDFKEKYFVDAAAEYEKRLGGFVNYRDVTIKESRLDNSPTDAQIKAALASEAERIAAAIPKKAVVFALCIEGKQYSSTELATLILSAKTRSNDLAFIIGSSFGLDEQLKARCDYRISMSKMTFPHQLAKVMLLEQLYRAEMINSNRSYHK